MKQLDNKKISFIVEQFDKEKGILVNVTVETTYLELIFNTCKRPVEGGYNWELIERISRIKDIYEKNKDNNEMIAIEDADFSFMKERFLSNNNWTTFDKNLIEMKKYIETI